MFVSAFSYPLSTVVLGLNGCIVKQAISVAPMITVALLNHYGYTSTPSSVFKNSVPTVPLVGASVAQHSAGDTLTDAMFYMVCAVPLVLGLIQLIVWQFYTIRDSHKADYILLIEE